MNEMDLDFLINAMPAKANYTLQEACALKGVNVKTAVNKRWLQPNGGVAENIIGGRRTWTRNLILQWINLSDEELRSMRR